MRQRAAQSRHQLLPARGACSACKWCTAAGRWCSDVANSSPASASPSVGSSSRCSACVPAALACSSGIRSCDRLAQSHLKSTLAIAGTYSRRATSSAVTSSAPSCTPSVEPLLCLCASRSGHRRRHEQPQRPPTPTRALMFVSIGACSGGIRSCGRLAQPHLKSTLAIAERLASQPEQLRCRCGCAIGSRSAAKSNRMARTAGAFAASRISSPPWQ